MTFQVYYRKWRPQRFGELVGQEHVSSTLRRAAQQGRVAHAYLFSGPRGTGKTSTARLLSKAVNCLSLQEGDPCNSCVRCQAVNEGRFIDLIELDAASNRGIDEIRNIRDKVNLAPAEGSYKVYIIDEAHMLTEHASNAFLKTLEEPPGHAIFVLCTTEPQKILPTIISRCQRFDFRRLNSAAIMGRLRTISLEEGVEIAEEALTALSHSTGGSLRDAENLLEQLVVSYGDRIGPGEVYELLGLGQGERALEFLGYLLIGDASGALTTINRASWDGSDLRQLHRQVVDLLRGMLMLQCGSRDSLDLPQETISALENLAPQTSTARVMKSLKFLGEVNVKHDASSSLPLELAVVEVCLEAATGTVATQRVATPAPPSTPHPAGEPSAERIASEAPSRYPPSGAREHEDEIPRVGDSRSIPAPAAREPGEAPDDRSPTPAHPSGAREDKDEIPRVGDSRSIPAPAAREPGEVPDDRSPTPAHPSGARDDKDEIPRVGDSRSIPAPAAREPGEAPDDRSPTPAHPSGAREDKDEIPRVGDSGSIPAPAAREPEEVTDDRSPTPAHPSQTDDADHPHVDSRPPSESPAGLSQEEWGSLIKTLSRIKGKRFNIGALLRDCDSQSIEGETLVLGFAHRSHLERMQEELDDPLGMKTVRDAVLKSLGISYQLRLTQGGNDRAKAGPAHTQSPLVRAALSMGARIMEEREE